MSDSDVSRARNRAREIAKRMLRKRTFWRHFFKRCRELQTELAKRSKKCSTNRVFRTLFCVKLEQNPGFALSVIKDDVFAGHVREVFQGRRTRPKTLQTQKHGIANFLKSSTLHVSGVPGARFSCRKIASKPRVLRRLPRAFGGFVGVYVGFCRNFRYFFLKKCATFSSSCGTIITMSPK